MSVLTTMIREFVGLFVDDGSFALEILAWLAGGFLGLHALSLEPRIAGGLLFAGLSVILVENVYRATRKAVARLNKPDQRS
jgi:hypothetical protein